MLRPALALPVLLLGSRLVLGNEIPVVFVPPPRIPPFVLGIEWRDARGAVIARAEGVVRDGRLDVGKPPRDADAIRVAGDAWISRVKEIRVATKAGLSLLPPARLVIPATDRLSERLFIGSRDESNAFEVEGSPVLRDSEGRREVLLFPGTFSAVLDWGPDRVPTVVEGASLSAGRELVLEAPSFAGRQVLVQALSRDDEKPLTGAGIAAPEGSSDVDTLLARALSERSGPSGSDGRINVGLIPSEVRKLAVRAPGRRTATFGLPTADAPALTQISVRLPRLQRVRVGVDLEASRDYRDVVFSVALESGTRAAGGAEAAPEHWQTVRTASLKSGKGALFENVSEGLYRLRLAAQNSTVWQQRILVSGRAEDPDEQSFSASIVEWVVDGITLLPTGEPVVARVSLGAVKDGLVSLGSAMSDSDGRFQLRVLGPRGVRATLMASSSSPPGTGIWTGKLAVGEAAPDEVRIVVKTTGLRVTTVDARNDAPLVGCTVQAAFSNEEGGMTQSLKTDSAGVVQFTGLVAGTIEILPACEGFSAGAATTVPLADGEFRELRIPLAPAPESVLRVRSGGIPITGAAVFLPAPLGGRPREFGFYAPAQSLGTTDAAGELALPGGPSAGNVVFVVAAGLGLGSARLPLRCDEGTACQVVLELSPTRLNERLGVRNARGAPLNPAWLGVLVDSVAIPPNVLSALLSANGRISESLFVEDSARVWSTIPQLLSPGIHEAVYILRSRGMPTGLLLGRFSLPADEPVLFTVDIPSETGTHSPD